MPDYQLDQILRAASRLASAARFEGIALTGKTSDSYRQRLEVTAAAWTALRAAVEHPPTGGYPQPRLAALPTPRRDYSAFPTSAPGR